MDIADFGFGLGAGLIVGGCVGILGAVTLAGPRIDALEQEKWNAVSSGAVGGVTCNENTDDPITKGRTFEAKQIAGNAELRQLLSIDKATNNCTVWLIKPAAP